MEQSKETQSIRTVKKYAKPPGKMHGETEAQKQRRRNQDAEQRIKILPEGRQAAEEEGALKELYTQEQHILDDAWQEVDIREIITEATIQPIQKDGGGGGGGPAPIPNREDGTKMPISLTYPDKMTSNMPTTIRSSSNKTHT